MAVCGVCGREMLEADGCIGEYVRIDGKRYKRIYMGGNGDFYENAEEGRCGDCGAKPGFLHHWGCDCERCPKCGMQMIACECGEEEYVLLA